MPNSRFFPLLAALGPMLSACDYPESQINPVDSGSHDSGAAPDASGSASSSSGATGSGGALPMGAVHFLGRFDHSDPQHPTFTWPGSAIMTRFSGTGIDLLLHDDGSNYFAVSIDGADPTLLSTSPAHDVYPLAQGLSDGEHTVTVVRRTESFVGPSHFLGFAPAGNRPLIPTPPPYDRRIELIGDSITCGYGNVGEGPNCPFSTATEDAYLTYGAIAARALGAEARLIAYSGKGALQDGGGNTADQMPELYERALADDPSSHWDFSAWTADVVVINLGTNDFGPGDPGQPFADAYLGLVQQVRGHYPMAYIVCAVGTMVSDSYPPGAMAMTKTHGYIQGVVGSMNAAGDARVSFLDLGVQDGDADGLGCDWHPSVKTHQLMAGKLTAALKALTGW